jgi:peptide/nickel transport system substrate-binding protein
MTSVALAVGVAACSGSDPASQTKGGGESLTLGALSDVRSFDPAAEEVGHQMQYLEAVYDTLLHRAPDGTLEPGLAREWAYSEDKVTLTLDLREDAKFSDGTPLDADAVVASLERFAKANGPRASALAAVTGYDAPSATRVVLTLGRPDPALLNNLTLVAGMIVNPAVTDSAALANSGAGSGPYVLDAGTTTKADHYTFVRSKHYYDEEAYPYDKIVIRVLAEPTARLNALRSGQVDAAVGDVASLDQAESAGLTVVKSPGDWQGLFLIDRDGTVAKELGDVRVRQAINHAIDGDAILENLVKGHGAPTTQIFSPSSTAYDTDLDDAYPYDKAKAKQLLADAGYPDGFTLSLPQPPILPELFPVIKQQLGEVGIRVEYTATTEAEGLTPYFSGKFPAFAFSWGASDPWLDASLLTGKDGAWNVLHAEDPEMADLMGRIAIADGEEQAALYQQLSARIVAEAWFNPWYVLDNLYFADDSVDVQAQAQQVVPDLDNFSPTS